MKLTKRNKILLIIVGVLIVLSLNFFQKEVKGFFYFISSPIQKNLRQTNGNLSDFFVGIFRGEIFKQENRELKLQIQRLLGEKGFWQALQRENETLRGALELGLQKEFRLALAEIISQDIGQDSVLINQGSKDGLSEGMPVITQEKVLLGRITEAFDDFSRVALTSHQESSFDVAVPDRNVSGLVRGRGGQSLELDLVFQDKEVKEGDLVISTALGGIYPKGLLVGLIKTVERSDIQPFYQIVVSPFFDLSETKTVLIILDF